MLNQLAVQFWLIVTGVSLPRDSIINDEPKLYGNASDSKHEPHLTELNKIEPNQTTSNTTEPNLTTSNRTYNNRTEPNIF